MPSERSGTSAPVAAALLAASGPATPSIAPLPNSSGCFASFFSSAYERNVGISAPPAGIEPNGNPMKVARSQGGIERFQSSIDIQIDPFSFSSVSGSRLVYAAT